MNNQIIHILAGKANPNTMNGVNKVVDALATEQVKLGLSVTVVGIANNTQKRHAPSYGYKLFLKKGNFSYPNEVLSFLLENSDENTAFHFHSVFIPWFLPLIKVLKKNNRKHIFLTPHGQYVSSAMALSWKKRVFFKFFDKKILKLAEAVHVIGCETENNSYIYNNAKRVVVIPNGFYISDVRITENHPDLHIGYLGRLECKQKGLDLLIPAFVQYHQNGGKAILDIAGLGPHESRLKKMVNEMNANDFIHFKGKVYDKEKWNFILQCAALITPSRWDVVPTSCLEAASVRRPQLVTAATNLAPYINKYNAGLSMKQASIDNIIKILFSFEKIFYNTREYEKMCDGAKKMIVEELNWEKIDKRIVKELYGLEIK